MGNIVALVYYAAPLSSMAEVCGACSQGSDVSCNYFRYIICIFGPVLGFFELSDAVCFASEF